MSQNNCHYNTGQKNAACRSQSNENPCPSLPKSAPPSFRLPLSLSLSLASTSLHPPLVSSLLALPLFQHPSFSRLSFSFSRSILHSFFENVPAARNLELSLHLLFSSLSLSLYLSLSLFSSSRYLNFNPDTHTRTHTQRDRQKAAAVAVAAVFNNLCIQSNAHSFHPCTSQSE